MAAFPAPLADLLHGIRWRALAALWVLGLAATALLVVTDAPSVVVAIVMGGAAAMIAATTVAGAVLAPSRAAGESPPEQERLVVYKPSKAEREALAYKPSAEGQEALAAKSPPRFAADPTVGEPTEDRAGDDRSDAVLPVLDIFPLDPPENWELPTRVRDDDVLRYAFRSQSLITEALVRHAMVAFALSANPNLDDLESARLTLPNLWLARAQLRLPDVSLPTTLKEQIRAREARRFGGRFEIEEYGADYHGPGTTADYGDEGAAADGDPVAMEDLPAREDL